MNITIKKCIVEQSVEYNAVFGYGIRRRFLFTYLTYEKVIKFTPYIASHWFYSIYWESYLLDLDFVLHYEEILSVLIKETFALSPHHCPDRFSILTNLKSS